MPEDYTIKLYRSSGYGYYALPAVGINGSEPQYFMKLSECVAFCEDKYPGFTLAIQFLSSVL